MDEISPLAVPGATIARQVIWLATPVLVEQALLYLVGLSDTILTGRYLSADHLAAVTVASHLLWFLGSLLKVVSVGGTALVARAVGANQRPDVVRIAQQAITMAVLVAA
jgi:Na+-driven multidrug efflux pump